MIGPIPARVLLVLTAIATPPGATSGGATAQTLAEWDGHSISAAIEEALRSPFHARTGTGAFTAGDLPTHPSREGPQTPAPDSLPSFAKVFVPTLAATYLADLVGFWAAICWGYGGGGGCIDDETINLALWVTVPVVVPALAAGGVTDRFLPGFVGSALGTGAAIVALRAIDPDSGPVVWIVPAIDAAVTTLLTLALHDLEY